MLQGTLVDGRLQPTHARLSRPILLGCTWKGLARLGSTGTIEADRQVDLTMQPHKPDMAAHLVLSSRQPKPYIPKATCGHAARQLHNPSQQTALPAHGPSG